ncbi:MAG: hypothetical protein U0P30_12585 [Vicinamibacterales bacterium]
MTRLALAALAVFLAAPAWAQQLSLDIRDGLVTLQASNVPARQILAEWARVGGTRVVGGERIAGAPLTLFLEGVPEAKALDIILRGAAGYMAANRAVPGTGRSRYDRIMVLASSTPPAGGGNAAGATNRPAPPRPFGVPPAVEPPDASDTGANDPEPVAAAEVPQVNPFANAFGQPGMPQPFGQPGQNPFGQPVQNPFGQAVPNPFGQPLQPQSIPQGGLFQPVQQPPAGSPGFFGVAGASTPGLVQQPAAQPGQPAARPRPQQ